MGGRRGLNQRSRFDKRKANSFLYKFLNRRTRVKSVLKRLQLKTSLFVLVPLRGQQNMYHSCFCQIEFPFHWHKPLDCSAFFTANYNIPAEDLNSSHVTLPRIIEFLLNLAMKFSTLKLSVFTRRIVINQR